MAIEAFKSGLKRLLPTLDELHRAVRETTLIVFIMFTMLSLTIFWAELFDYHSVTGDQPMAVRWMINAVVFLLLAWITLIVARLVKLSWSGDSNVQ